MQLDAAALDAHIGARRRGQHFLRRVHIDGALRRYQGHRLFRGQTHARLLALQAQLAAGGVQTDALFLDRAAIAAQSLGEEHHALRHADGQVVPATGKALCGVYWPMPLGALTWMCGCV
ncbi:hypothetical protein G6F64_014659 [Rhizopus arrhizus]|uniref:Uncharacterized protein n=1 Tax=Rhizopus oryzae TaxID=64495 RepID=A0A9P7BIR3_RHIOR|nr:hypothetical protein G6F64_014659 [Rhizopus arrhizus]